MTGYIDNTFDSLEINKLKIKINMWYDFFFGLSNQVRFFKCTFKLSIFEESVKERLLSFAWRTLN